MPLANPIVKRLAEKKPGWAKADHCGLVLVTSWPASEALRSHYDNLRKALEASLPKCVYLYPPSTLHVTVATLRAFTAGALDGEDREAEADRWRAVLDAARNMPEWPTKSFRLRIGKPSLEGAAGIVKYEEVGGTKCIEAMRACVRKAITAAGGLAAEGSGSREHAKALPGAPPKEPAPHIPDIVHSTVCRWASEPTESELAAAHAAFKALAATFEPMEVTVSDGACAVFEDVPFMHIPHNNMAEQVFWRSKKPKAAKSAPTPTPWLMLLAEAILTFLLPCFLVLAAVYLSGKKTYWYLPGKPGDDLRLHALAR